ncbi:hypothetical protein, partial [uncultured Megasphaera sp.]|uniref:hypothetical protein n=1 Tax=uncultured Megasphaera sp. TaxID=165188 RepID=UPI0025EEC855
SCIGRTLYRGFKSHALRHKIKDDHGGGRLFLSFIKSVFSANIFFTHMDTVAHTVLPHHALQGFLTMHGVSDSIMPEDLIRGPVVPLLRIRYNIVYKEGGVRC